MFFNTSSPSSFALALNGEKITDLAKYTAKCAFKIQVSLSSTGNTEFRTVTSNNETTLIATTSCQDARFIKSALTSLQIPISLDETILCGKLETDLSEHPTMSFVFLNVFHNTLECIADLMVYWKRFEVALVYDKYAGQCAIPPTNQPTIQFVVRMKVISVIAINILGVDPTLAVRYLAKRSILANIIKLEQTDDLLNISLRLIKSNANVILICNADITNSVINTVNKHSASCHSLGQRHLHDYNL